MTQIRNVTTSAAVLGQTIASARHIKGLKQSDIGAALGLGASSWSRIEKGDSAITYEQLRMVARLLEMSVGEIDEIVVAGEKEAVRRGMDIDNNGFSVDINKIVDFVNVSMTIPVVGTVLRQFLGEFLRYTIENKKIKILKDNS